MGAVRPVINIMQRRLEEASGSPDGADTAEAPAILHVLSTIQPPVEPVSSPAPSLTPSQPSIWSESLDLIEQVGRSARDERDRAEAFETRMRMAADELGVARSRIGELEAATLRHLERERELALRLQDAEARLREADGRLQEAEKWLHVIRGALRVHAGDEEAIPTASVANDGVERWKGTAVRASA